MNNQRKEFEERLLAAGLSEEQEAEYRRLNLELLRSRLVCNYAKLDELASKIKPMVRINIDDRKVVFTAYGQRNKRALITDAPVNENYLALLYAAKVEIKPVKCNLYKMRSFTCYFPAVNAGKPCLSAETVLQQLPEKVATKLVFCFEVCFDSGNPEQNYDAILKCHKATVILWSKRSELERAVSRMREKIAERDESEAKQKQKQDKDKKSESPCRFVPLRRHSS